MPTHHIILMVSLFLVVDAVIVVTLLRLAGASLQTLASRYPECEPSPGAVRKNFQSFAFGMMNLGGCVHVIVDDHCLHLRPARFARWCGMKNSSIPWGEIKLEDVGKRFASASMGEVWMRGPAWALSLADPGRRPRQGASRDTANPFIATTPGKSDA